MINEKKEHVNKVKKVLIVDQSTSMLNKGTAALLTATINIIKRAFPNAEVVIVSHTKEVNKSLNIPSVPHYNFITKLDYKKQLCRTGFLMFMVMHYRIYKKAGFLTKSQRMDRTLLQYVEADLIIHATGDNLTEDYGLPYQSFESLATGLLLRKHCVILGQSIGPFKDRKIILLAKKILNSVDVIITRDQISARYLNELGIDLPDMHVLPDISFSLNPASDERVDQIVAIENLRDITKPVIVFSISVLFVRYGLGNLPINEKIDNLVETITTLVEYCQDSLHATIVFISHVIAQNNDDRIINHRIASNLENKSNVYVINGEYSHEEYKAFIRKYGDLLIGSRMHACLAALSVDVPIVAFAYSDKFPGVLGDFGIDDCIIDIRKINCKNDLVSKAKNVLDHTWNRREELRTQIKNTNSKNKVKIDKINEIIKGIFFDREN